MYCSWNSLIEAGHQLMSRLAVLFIMFTCWAGSASGVKAQAVVQMEGWVDAVQDTVTGQVTVSFIVSRTGDLGTPLTINYRTAFNESTTEATAQRTATAATDEAVVAASSVTFPAGEDAIWLDVPYTPASNQNWDVRVALQGSGSGSYVLGTVTTLTLLMADPVMDPHYKDLGSDPALGGRFRKNEADTAIRVEKQQSVKLKRYHPEKGKKGDWIDEKGVIYDGCSPSPSKFFDKQWDSYKASLLEHLKLVDKVVIDVTGLGLTPAQLKKLDDFINSLPKEARDKIIRIK